MGRGFKQGKNGQESFNSKGRGFKQAGFLSTDENLKDEKSNGKDEIVCQICNKLRHTAIRCHQKFNQAYQLKDTIKALVVMSMSDGRGFAWFPVTVQLNT